MAALQSFKELESRHFSLEKCQPPGGFRPGMLATIAGLGIFV
jgi:hypothetical protein